MCHDLLAADPCERLFFAQDMASERVAVRLTVRELSRQILRIVLECGQGLPG